MALHEDGKKTVVILGAGVGGLTAAAELAFGPPSAHLAESMPRIGNARVAERKWI